METQAIIEINDLCKNYGTFAALDHLSLRVMPGDFYAFIGPNGAGKSTTIRILLGLIQKTSGQAQILGYPCQPSQSDLLKHIAYLPSESAFYPHLKVKEVLRLAAKLQGLQSTDETKRLCHLFELNPQLKISELSLGNRKKVSIVCALQHQAQVYIFDEPTSGLDPLMQERFWQELQQRNQAGATVFVSSHVLSEVQKYCHKAAFIRQGQIILEDTISHLVQSAAKRVILHGISQFDSIEGMSQVTCQGESISFLYQGSVARLLDHLRPFQDRLLDLQIQELSMEELFRHYYNQGKQEVSQS
ncbi:ABC transporter ATP-binding protein [Vaginisenegalia massiliensis]|uniref:ABC transporter ATP-binding protein n=1 Tax=Vaginisenegalia massiliensis TaxID=2058294 RepID=UPI000F53B1E3|nr:ABC transporter ATP-binding protein [Vaginisenegalia massiliensis]